MKDSSDKSSINEVSKGNGQPASAFISNIRGLYITMIISAMYPQKDSRYGFNLIWWIWFLGMTFEVFGLTAGILVATHDLKTIADNLGFAVGFALVFPKWLVFTSNQKLIQEIFDFMEEDWKNLEINTSMIKSVPDSRRIMMTYSRFARIFFYFKMIAMILGSANCVNETLAVRKHFDDTTDPADLFPIGNSWYPVDYEKNFNVQVLAAIQMITVLMTLLTKATIDSCLVLATLHLCSQFKILRYFIESMAIDFRDSKFITPEMRRAFRRHQELLRAADCIQEVFSLIGFMNFLICVQGSGTLAYLTMTELDKENPNITVLLKNWCFYVTMLISVFSYCFCGHLMSDESVAIADAAYNAPWYNSTRSMSLLLYIVMIRAQRPVMIIGGKLIPMTMQTFITFVNFAVSYVSILRVASMSGD